MNRFNFSPRSNRGDQIAWQPWGREVFRRAQEEGRPVLLSISALWCRWCHIMDETTYSDRQVIDAINHRFLPVRVDRDRRPDVDGRYNMGGWPTTVFLTPAGRLITGGTYIPVEQMHRLLRRVSRLCATRGEEIRQGDRDFLRAETADGHGRSFPLLGQQVMEEAAREGNLNQLAGAVEARLADAYDEQWAGFGRAPRYAPKFPYPELLAALCSREEKGQMNRRGRLMLTYTLDSMAEGDLFDQTHGGFFRYSTHRDWREPHYEKLAMDNAQLAEVYLRAGRIRAEPGWTAVAEEILAYLTDSLRREDGGFGGSQDADEAFNRGGQRGEVAPGGDRTLYADVNARVASAFLLAHRITGVRSYREAGLAALRAVEESCADRDDDLFHFAPEEDERVPGFLGDYTELSLAHLDAHAVTGELIHLDRALVLADRLRSQFGIERGAFADIPRRLSDRPGMLRRVRVPLTENARAASLCRKVGIIRDDPSWLQQGLATLNQTVRRAFAAGPAGGAWLCAYWQFREPAPHVRLSLPDNHDGMMLRAAGRARDRHTVLDVDDGQVRKPLAYVRRGSSCLPPIADPEKLRTALQKTGATAAATTPPRR